MLASTPSTEPEADMREGSDAGPSRFRPGPIISAPSAKRRGPGQSPVCIVFFLFPFSFLNAFVHLRSGLRSSVR
jgi:hypothetical protein